MTRIILARHGQSEANLDHTFSGHTDAPLTPLGRAQAEAVADYLESSEHIDAVYVSDLSRARDTGAATAARFGLTPIPEPAFREIYAGEWEGLGFDYLEIHYQRDRSLWGSDLKNACCTGGETLREVFDRVAAALAHIIAESKDKTVLIASHWTPILCAICYLHGKDIESISDFLPPSNCSLHFFSDKNGAFTAERLNVTEHLGALDSAYFQA